MKYFAYGSNMSIRRLQARTPSAEKVGIFVLNSHDLRFHKAGDDGSGKCDAYFSDCPDDYVIGVVFDIDESEKETLDKVEGLGSGYNEKWVTVTNKEGGDIEAITYYATKIDDTRKPYPWYKAHVLTGAKESQFPDSYIQKIINVQSTEDQDKQRAAREGAIYLNGLAKGESANSA